PMVKTHQGKEYLQSPGDHCLYFAGERLLVFAPEKGIQHCLGLPKSPGKGPLDEALARASETKNQLVAGINIPPSLVDKARNNLPPQATAFKALLEMQAASLTVAVDNDIDWELAFAFPDSDRAEQ